MITQVQKRKVHRCLLRSACVLADIAVWMPSTMPHGRISVGMSETYMSEGMSSSRTSSRTASSPCWQSRGSSTIRLYPKSYSGLKSLNLHLIWRWLFLVKKILKGIALEVTLSANHPLWLKEVSGPIRYLPICRSVFSIKLLPHCIFMSSCDA